VLFVVPRFQHREVEQRGAVAPGRVQIGDVLQRGSYALLVVAHDCLRDGKERRVLAKRILARILIRAALLRLLFTTCPRGGQDNEKQDDPREDGCGDRDH